MKRRRHDDGDSLRNFVFWCGLLGRLGVRPNPPRGERQEERQMSESIEIGRASCRERV